MPHELSHIIPVALYIGPDVLMPVASAIAAVAGFLLMFWRRTVALGRRIGGKIAGLFRRRGGGSGSPAAGDPPTGDPS